MNFESLNALSYRELQSKAKACGIAANKKKEFLIEALLADQEPVSDSAENAEVEVEVEAEITVSAPEVVECAEVEVVQNVPVELEVVLSKMLNNLSLNQSALKSLNRKILIRVIWMNKTKLSLKSMKRKNMKLKMT